MEMVKKIHVGLFPNKRTAEDRAREIKADVWEITPFFDPDTGGYVYQLKAYFVH